MGGIPKVPIKKFAYGAHAKFTGGVHALEFPSKWAILLLPILIDLLVKVNPWLQGKLYNMIKLHTTSSDLGCSFSWFPCLANQVVD